MSFNTNVNGLYKYLRTVNPYEEERLAFTIYEGGMLSLKNQVEKELLLLSSFLAYEVDYSYEKYNDLVLAVEFYKSILDICEEKEDKEIIECLKRVVVYLQLEIGCKVSFALTFLDMKEEGTLDFSYSAFENLTPFDPEELYFMIYRDMTGKSRNINKNKYEEFKNEDIIYKDNYKKEDAIDDYKRYKVIFKKLKNKIYRIKASNFEIYAELKLVINDIEDKYLSNSFCYFEDKGLFVEKFITFMEYNLELDYTFEPVYYMMLDKGQLDFDFNVLSKFDNLNMEYLETLFINGKKYRK